MAFTSTALRNCIKNCGGSDRALALADLVLTFPKDLKEVPHFCGRPTTYDFFLRILPHTAPL